MKAKPVLMGAAAVLALGALLAWGFRPEPVPVDLAVVARGDMAVTVNADGKTRIKDIFRVASPITGFAERSPVSVGDRVTGGETVVAVVRPVAPALLDARSRASAQAAVAEAEAALRVAESNVTQAREDLIYASTQLARAAELVSRGVASETRLEDASQLRAIKQAALKSARFTEEMAAGALARARSALIEPNLDEPGNGTCCIEMHAPADGVVLAVESISERPVTMGLPLLTIGRPDDLEIVADLLSSDAVLVAPGAHAVVERWGGAQPLEAVLRKIEPAATTKVSALGIEEQRVNAVFDLLSPYAERPGLGDGFAVFLRIEQWRAQDVLQVPLSALFRTGADWSVFTVQDGHARRVPVTVGHRNNEVAQVLSGLEAGARVITHPSDRVQDGTGIVDRAELE
jgi:HlyD family secretion protein